MNYPIQFGFPQVVLIIMFFIGLLLLIFFIKGLVFREREIIELEDKDGNRFKRYSRARRHFRWHHGAGGILLMLVSFFFLWLAFAIQSYLSLTGDIKVATVQAVPDLKQQNMMRVKIVFYAPDGSQISETASTKILNGQQNSDGSYEVLGNRVTLQANVVEFPTWFNFFGIHSGYKLTRLMGQYESYDLEANAKHTLLVLNGGDDDFFAAAKNNALPVPFAKGYYASGVIVPANGVIYDIYINQTGLKGEPKQ